MAKSKRGDLNNALLEAAKFALSVLKANPIELSEKMAIERLEEAIAALAPQKPTKPRN